MGESACSDDGKYYSIISRDGRLRIWDTEANVLKQEFTPDLHLTSPPSCLKWISVGISSGQQKSAKRKSLESEQLSQCIALGTASGKILIYSVTQAKVEHILKEEKPGTYNSFITSLDWQRKYGLFSCNKSNHVISWDISDGKIRNKYNVMFDNNTKQGNSVSAIKIVPHSLNTPSIYLITASWQVCLWRLHDNSATIIRSLGHNITQHALLSLATLKKASWLVVGSKNERLLSFWDVTITEENLPQVNGEPTKKQRKLSNTNVQNSTSPTYNFILEDAPKYVDLSVKDDENGTTLKIGAVTRSGVMHYYNHVLNGASPKPLKPIVTIQVTTPDARPLPLQCCQLADSDVLAGYSDGPALNFERITDKSIATIQVTTLDARPLPLQCCQLADSDVLAGYSDEPALNFERIVPELKSKTQVLIRGESTKKNRRSSVNHNEVKKHDEVNYVEPLGGQVGRKRTVSGVHIEVPMEARLENLSLDIKSRNSSAVNQNLSKLLTQALHSKDRQLIQTVLLKDDAAIANRTVASLPVDCVPLLLQQLVLMANRKTNQCSSACTWAKAVLKCHAATLLAAANSSNNAHAQLTQLLAVFTQRRSQLGQLLNLRGRLELTMSQRRRPGETAHDAVLEYNDDSSSSSEEMEVEKYQSDSDQSWDDEKDEEKPEKDADSDDE